MTVIVTVVESVGLTLEEAKKERTENTNVERVDRYIACATQFAWSSD